MNDVLINFKVSTGEEIIAKYLGSDKDNITIKQPRVLSIQQMQNGQAGATFIPLMFLGGATEEVEIPRSAIVARAKTVDVNFEKRYLEAVSGISLATQLNG